MDANHGRGAGSLMGISSTERAQALPLLKTIGRVAFVDDDPRFLETLKLTLPPDDLEFYLAPRDLDLLDARLERNRELLRHERTWLSALAHSQLNGATSSAAHLALQYLARTERLALVTTLITDYAMPGRNGIDLSARYEMPGLLRTLLTGIVDEKAAVRAFNARAIERYLPKQSPSLMAQLLQLCSDNLAASGAARATTTLSLGVAENLRDMLTEPEIAASVRDLLQSLGVSEYVVMGAPQGIVCSTSDGQVLWIQLETAESLRDLEEVARENGLGSDVCARIANRASIVSEEFMGQLDKAGSEMPAVVLSERPFLCAAVFSVRDLPQELTPAVRASA